MSDFSGHRHTWKWVKRDRKKDRRITVKVRKYFGVFEREVRVLGPVVHANVCTECGFKDR